MEGSSTEEQADGSWVRKPLRGSTAGEQDKQDKRVVLITNHRVQSLKATVRFTSSDVRIDIFERTDPNEDLVMLMPARTYKMEPEV